MGNVEWEEIRREYEQPHMSSGQVAAMRDRIKMAEKENRKERKNKWSKAAVAAAAAVVIFAILPNTSADIANAMEKLPLLGRLVEVVTIRDYHYEDERNQADVEVVELVPQSVTDTPVEEETAENLSKSSDEINAEIARISEQFLTDFTENLENEQGYQDISVTSEVITTTQDYFTLKLDCYQASGSGAQWNYYYTIDLNTGNRLALADLFTEGADYITPISENIKTQMREQMAADENKLYWVDYTDVPEWNFDAITDETEFYINENGTLVISFQEGEVAPMYMGVVTFEIPDEVLAGIKK